MYVWQGVRISKSNENAWRNLTILPGPERTPFFLQALNTFLSHHLKWWGEVIKTKIKRIEPPRKSCNAKGLVFNNRPGWLISVSTLKTSCMLTQPHCPAVQCLCSSCHRKWKDNSYCYVAAAYCDWFIVSLLGRNTSWSYKLVLHVLRRLQHTYVILTYLKMVTIRPHLLQINHH